MERDISLYDLLALSIGTTERGSVHFGALHALLLALLERLDAREATTRWSDAAADGPLEAAEPEPTGPEPEPEPTGPEPTGPEPEPTGPEPEPTGPEPEQHTQPDSGSGPDRTSGLGSWVQTCEERLSQALKTIDELKKKTDDLEETVLYPGQNQNHLQPSSDVEEELEQLQQKAAVQPTELERCCHRVDALESAVNSLEEHLRRYPGPEQLRGWATRDQPVLDRPKVEKESVGPEDPPCRPVSVNRTGPHLDLPPPLSTPTSAPTPPIISGDDSTSAAAAETAEASSDWSDEDGTTEPEPADGPSSTRVGSVCAEDHPPTSASTPAAVARSITSASPPHTVADLTRTSAPQEDSGLGRHQAEVEEAVRSIRELQEKLSQLEAQLLVLEAQKVDRIELAQPGPAGTSTAPQDACSQLTQQLQQHRALIDTLMSDRHKLESVEDMLMSLMSQERDSSSGETSVRAESDPGLSQQVAYLRKALVKLQEEVKHLKLQQAQCEGGAADQHLQDQLDDLRGMLEDMTLSLTSQLSGSLQQGVSDGSVGGTLGQRQGGAREQSRADQVQPLGQEADAAPVCDQDVELLDDVQAAVRCLEETTRSLHEDCRTKQGHIQELYKAAEELQDRKADRQTVESEMQKADKWALDSKVSRLQFDVATERLSSMFHDLLNKMSGQEQDWKQVVDRLSAEMEHKLNRMELDSLKKQLEDRWRSIHKKLQEQSAPEQDDAAGIRRQLVERFRCLSCDRPVLKQTPGPILLTLPSFPAFPAPKSIRPWTLEQIRQHYSSNRGSNVPVRNCGGNRVNVGSGQRRSDPQNPRLQTQAEGDDRTQEADILGRDRRIYRGRFSAHQLRNAETKLPTVDHRDGKTMDRTKSSAPQLEPHALVHPQPLSARSLQCSHPASSGSGRDWPVSALGCCTSQSSVGQGSAADDAADPESCEPCGP